MGCPVQLYQRATTSNIKQHYHNAIVYIILVPNLRVFITLIYYIINRNGTYFSAGSNV